MRNVNLIVVPGLIGAAWLGLAVGAVMQLAQMGSTFGTLRAAEAAHQTAHRGPIVALATPRSSAQ